MIFVDMDWVPPALDAECWCVVVKRALDRGGTPGLWFSPSSTETLSEVFSNSSVSFFFFFFKEIGVYLFIYFGCVGSSFLCEGFL